MATIAICPLPELGHVLPTLRIAKTLRQRGHRVVYVVLDDCRELLAGEGFEVVSICAARLPVGALAATRARARASRVRIVADAIENAWRAVAAHALLLGDEDARLAAIGADLALCDRDWDEPALAFGALGTRVATFSVTLWGAYPGARLRDYVVDREVPPMSSPAAAGPNVAGWAAHAGHEFVARILREGLQLAEGDWTRVIRRRRALRTPRGPMLVLCPELFDVPRQRRSADIVYGGPSIDLERRAPELDVELHEPLVYCAIGSQDHRMHAGVLRAIVDVARTRAWQLVISAGDAIDPAGLGELPDRITIRREVPQLQVLAHAQAAIVHGGLGTIKECIWFGVPMLVLPGGYDQPGNGARVEHHGLGFARSRDRIAGGELGALIERLVVERERRDRLARWAAQFHELERAELHVAAVEAAL